MFAGTSLFSEVRLEITDVIDYDPLLHSQMNWSSTDL